MQEDDNSLRKLRISIFRILKLLKTIVNIEFLIKDHEQIIEQSQPKIRSELLKIPPKHSSGEVS
jgi:hypothetical protein